MFKKLSVLSLAVALTACGSAPASTTEVGGKADSYAYQVRGTWYGSPIGFSIAKLTFMERVEGSGRIFIQYANPFDTGPSEAPPVLAGTYEATNDGEVTLAYAGSTETYRFDRTRRGTNPDTLTLSKDGSDQELTMGAAYCQTDQDCNEQFTLQGFTMACTDNGCGVK